MPSRFRFHGHAIGAGGRIEHPFHEFVEIQAASALPEIGGHGSGRSSEFRYRDILSFGHAYTEVTGSRALGPDGKVIMHKALVRSRVTDLNIMGMVTADHVEARLVMSTGFAPDDELYFKFTGTYFHNLRIAGVPVKVHLAVDLFDRLHRYRDLAKSYREKGEFRALYEQVSLKKTLKDAPERVQRWFQQAPEKGAEIPNIAGSTAMTLVRRLEPERPEFQCWGHIVYIEGFGSIHFAELGISNAERHLTMVRVDLGSPVDGTMDIVTGCVGGSPY